MALLRCRHALSEYTNLIDEKPKDQFDKQGRPLFASTEPRTYWMTSKTPGNEFTFDV
jgi:hypothetical protein